MDEPTAEEMFQTPLLAPPARIAEPTDPVTSVPPVPVAVDTTANKLSKGAWVGIGVAVVFVLVAVFSNGGSSQNGVNGDTGNESSATDYRNPVTLANDIAAQADARSADPNAHVTVTCIETSVKRQFTCNGQGSDGSTATVTATVSKDGQSYITSN